MAKPRFGDAVAARQKKTDNAKHGKSAKVAIRSSVLSAMGEARVFDAFAGSGVMYRAVWRNAQNYVGCDLRFFRDERTAFVADNRRVMRAIDLCAFNVFDLDAYGSPWEHCIILAERRHVNPGERIGLVVTEGSRMKLTFGGMPKILGELAGISHQSGVNRSIGEVVDRALSALCRLWGVRIEKQWRAESRSVGQARPLYIGLILNGVGGPSADSGILAGGMVANPA